VVGGSTTAENVVRPLAGGRRPLADLVVYHFLPEDDARTGRRVIARPLRWKLAGDPVGRTLTALHARLARLRHDHAALRSPLMYPHAWEPWQTRPDPAGAGFDEDRQTAVHHRWAEVDGGTENIVVVLNFGAADTAVDVPVPLNGRWTDLLAGFDGGAGWTRDAAGFRLTVASGSNWGRILIKD
jgi:pullulanase